MKCEKFTDNLPSLVYGELPEEEQERVSAHADSCGRCREDFEDFSDLRRAIGEVLALEEVPHLVSSSIMREARLVAAEITERKRSRGWRVFLFNPAFSATAVAIVVLGATLLLVDITQKQPPSTSNDNSGIHAVAPDSDSERTVAATQAQQPEKSTISRHEKPEGNESSRPDDVGAVALDDPNRVHYSGESLLDGEPDDLARKDDKHTIRKTEKKKDSTRVGRDETTVAVKQESEPTRDNDANHNRSQLGDDLEGVGEEKGQLDGETIVADEQNEPTLIAENYRIGLTNYGQERYIEAVDNFDFCVSNGITTDDYFSLALFHRGRSYQNMGQDDLAIRDFERLLELAGPAFRMFEETQYHMALSLLTLGRENEARIILNGLVHGRTKYADDARQILADLDADDPPETKNPPETKKKKHKSKTDSVTTW